MYTCAYLGQSRTDSLTGCMKSKVLCWLQNSDRMYLSCLHLQSTNGGLGLDRLQTLPLLQLTDAQPVMPQAEVSESQPFCTSRTGHSWRVTAQS